VVAENPLTSESVATQKNSSKYYFPNQKTTPINLKPKKNSQIFSNQENYSNTEIFAPPGGKDIFRQKSNFSVFYGFVDNQ